MIIKGVDHKKGFSIRKFPFIILFGILFTLFGIKFYAPIVNNRIAQPNLDIISCSAEKIEGEVFIHQGNQFSNVKSQSNEVARTGKYSIKLDKNNKYGFGYEMENANPGQSFKIAVWAYTKDKIKIKIAASGMRKNASDFYQQSQDVDFIDKQGWKKYELQITLPTVHTVQKVQFYVFIGHSEKGAVFFDDFEIIPVEPLKDIVAKLDFKPKKLHLHLEQKALDQLDRIKQQALKDGILIRSKDELVQGEILENQGVSKKVKVRYKGDWLDHLTSGTPSFRIQTKSDESWNRVQTFSIQNPKTRGNIREWFYHEFLKQMDILTPKYDFLLFQLNNKPPTIMAFEEHFNKNLLESQLRREGPILKFTEDRFWEGMKRSLDINGKIADSSNKNKAFWTSEIKPFKEKKTQKSPKLNSQFTIAQNLLNDYKFGLKPAKEVFDLGRMAKFVATVDLFMAYHSLTWHNQRFYYNPVTALLEPIGYDGHGDDLYSHSVHKPILSEVVYLKPANSIEPIHRLFYDKDFIEKYCYYLRKYSEPDFITRFVNKFSEAIDLREAFLQAENEDYKYDKDEIINRAKQIHQNIQPFETSIQIFKKNVDGDSVTLEINNTHILPIEIVGIGQKKLLKTDTVSYLVFPQLINKAPDYFTLQVSKNVKYVHYKLVGSKNIYKTAISNWSSPTSWSPRSELLNLADEPTLNSYTEDNGIILFKKKNYDFSKPLIIGKNKKVIVEPGTTFNFSNGAFFLSFSPLDFRGDKDEPIHINGMDKKSGAVTILQSHEPSIFRHVVFNHQNTMKYKGWELSGAVNLYESEVKVYDCQFINNLCEDALNIIRSNFVVVDCRFEHTFADALDIDYSKGKIINGHFFKIGNDALDFSTSTININGCSMKNVGDKGISAGEQAFVTAKNIEIQNANIGFASKDLSVLILDEVVVKNCKKGIVAYQKKPEYGPATVILKKYKFDNINNEFLIEEKSKLINNHTQE